MLSTLIGGASFAENFYHVAIIGPTGSGKSTLLSILYDNAKKNGFKVEYMDFVDEKVSTINLQDIDNTNITCFLCDNYSIQDLKTISKIRKRYPGLLITTIQSGQYYISSKPDLNINRCFFIPLSSERMIIENLKKRVELAGENLRLQIPEKFYEYIADLSINNWRIANDIANEWGEILFSDISILSTPDIEGLERLDSFYEAYSEYCGFLQKEVNKFNSILDRLTSKEMELLTVIVNRSFSEKTDFSPDDLMGDISGSKALIYRYLQRLVDHQLINVKERGRRKHFFISTLRRVIVENYIHEKITGLGNQ